ncbi:flagellar assembly protein T N-terminal domain-containing protein [Pseudogulbenkiania sp. MAI-1]|uniref:flagellar assembly protein T N-terminal domain-containing protein n=1 Tax=Pseudogulbenkiania sp. MAI-1 TaxID=990370 RepID=UPI00045E6647|nr:flagellar assembly protein T N-terminal domain-containing protein [Pseudogulbenkiania sp. MAI-1]
MKHLPCLRCIAALVAAFVLPLAPAGAAKLLGTGIATLDHGVPAARELAIQDAIRQAALAQGASLQSTEYAANGQLNDSTRLSAAPLSGKVTVRREYQRDGLYYVEVEVDTGDVRAGGQQCIQAGGRELRRRVVATYFNVERPADASDMPELATQLPVELARRLSAGGRFLASEAGRVSVLADPKLAEPQAGAEMVREIGRREGVQFVIGGRVLDTAPAASGLRASLFDGDHGGEQGVFYNGPFSGLLGGAVRYRPTVRQFDVEVWVYDALTGGLLVNHRLSTSGTGQVAPPAPRPFGSAAFWRSDYGRAVDQLLDRAVQQTADTLACIPFTARVARVEGGKRVYLDAGGLAGLAVGDRLLIYKPQPAAPLRGAGTAGELGIAEALSGTVVLTQVQPGLSIGVVQNARLGVEEGDYLRFLPPR